MRASRHFRESDIYSYCVNRTYCLPAHITQTPEITCVFTFIRSPLSSRFHVNVRRIQFHGQLYDLPRNVPLLMEANMEEWFKAFYATSDDGSAHQKYTTFFTQDATLIMGDKKAVGRAGMRLPIPPIMIC